MRKQSVITLASVALLILSYTAVALLYISPHNNVTNVDFFAHLIEAMRLSWSEKKSLVHGFYPLGYPFLMRLAITHDVDALRFGQFVAYLGGLLALISVFGISHQRRAGIAFPTMVGLLLISNPVFLRHSTYEGTDIPATGLQMVALLFLLPIRRDNSLRRITLLSLGAGLSLGFAYLIRYTSLMFFPVAALYILGTLAKRPRRAIVLEALFLFGFCVAAAPQIIPSLIVQHQPFYNMQAKNIWFGLYGNSDYVLNWPKVADDISLYDVFMLDPGGLSSHWSQEAFKAFSSLLLWPRSLHLLWIVGSGLIIFDRRIHLTGRLLLLAFLFLPIFATSLAWLLPRFLLVSLCIQTYSIALVVWTLIERLPQKKATPAGLMLAMVIASAGVLQSPEIIDWLHEPINPYPARVNSLLRLAGMDDPATVATNDGELHAFDTPARTRYEQLYLFLPKPASVDELLSLPQATNWRYLVLNYRSGYGDYSAIHDGAIQDKSRLVPLSTDESATIFCILPCAEDEMLADDIVFENGMELTGHRLRGTGGHFALYLRWRSQRPLDRSYRISVRLIDRAGTVKFQSDNQPQVWTYPTDRWKPHETVLDFYNFEPDLPSTEQYRLAIVVYDEQSLAPVHGDVPNTATDPMIVLPEILNKPASGG